MIEVMISLFVMTVGAMAIVALQQQTIRSNTHAREMTIAMQIAQLWVERLKQDSHRWNQVGFAANPGEPTPAQALVNTLYLSAVPDTNPVFTQIPLVDGIDFPSDRFDARGTELPADSADVPYYCVSFRPQWVYFGRAMRVDLRVYWPRKRQGAETGADVAVTQDCDMAQSALAPGGAQVNNFHFVYLPTVIRPTGVIR